MAFVLDCVRISYFLDKSAFSCLAIAYIRSCYGSDSGRRTVERVRLLAMAFLVGNGG